MSIYQRMSMVKHLRQFYLRYHTPRQNVKNAAKVKVPMRKKDGTLGKRYTVAYTCAKCGNITAKPEIDHIDPVGKEPSFPYNLEDLITYLRRLLCDESNLQVLCRKCHKAKSAEEKKAGYT